MQHGPLEERKRKFILLELMIVIAIIIILAAIAAPQFHMYRSKAYNNTVQPEHHTIIMTNR